MKKDLEITSSGRRDFLKGVVLGTAAVGAATTFFSDVESGSLSVAKAVAASENKKMAFIQWQPHTVPAAWSKGIEEVLKTQQTIDYELLDGQNKVEVQVSLIETLVEQGASVIFLQPIDSVALAPSIAKAKRAGISVITLNIDATEPHAAHVEMNHYYGAMDIAKAMGDAMGGKGKVAILNAPPGIIIRDQRTNGFVDGLKQHHPGIEIVADQVADWDRKKAQDVLITILAAHPDLGGVYGVNDSMALGAVDVAKEKGLLGKIVIFGNDGETGALESIAAGRTYRDAIYRRVSAGPSCRGGGDRACHGRRCGDGIRPAGPPADALPDRHKGYCRRDSALPALVRPASVSWPWRQRNGPFSRSSLRSNDPSSRNACSTLLLRCDLFAVLPVRTALRQCRQHGEPDVGLFLPGDPGDRAGFPDPAARHRSIGRRDRRTDGNGDLRPFADLWTARLRCNTAGASGRHSGGRA